jgi:hypothetical protein
MRRVVFRTLAGVLALAFAGLLVFGDTSKFSLREKWGLVVLTVGFAVYAFLDSDLGERFIWRASGGRDSHDNK